LAPLPIEVAQTDQLMEQDKFLPNVVVGNIFTQIAQKQTIFVLQHLVLGSQQ
jgi:hypothetical protein